ncbi:helix-turn-helix domain-containing protein [Humisphaera borealis]|uniref:Helix-turn-helix domain-containing protein n=1 Tax=Humisphaera borealis TaxID=2807512 RepID=A0A7M2WUY5_9BACT|nr:helix-turn-helix domain-containing protein [Humisphaera borealis]QOV89367.1 helix-turn-helix domain-containing protein [Humisphaera borealis]
MSNPLLNRIGDPTTPCLALRPREAAKALGVCERTLWQWTQDGDVPHVRRGKRIMYPTAALVRWLDEQTQATKAVDGAKPEGGANDAA